MLHWFWLWLFITDLYHNKSISRPSDYLVIFSLELANER